jgi:phage terminase small subunit
VSFEPIAGGDGMPPEPDWTTLFADDLDLESAHAHWGVAIRDLREAGTLAAANGHAIRRLVDFRVQYERASRHVAENGAILSNKRAKIGQFNPYWAVMKHADEVIRALEAELGIAPVRRGRAAKVKRAEKTQRASSRYLKSVSA